jgi:hypothetical protein
MPTKLGTVLPPKMIFLMWNHQMLNQKGGTSQRWFFKILDCTRLQKIWKIQCVYMSIHEFHSLWCRCKENIFGVPQSTGHCHHAKTCHLIYASSWWNWHLHSTIL